MSMCEIQSAGESEIAGFVAKTYEILNNQDYSKVIFWGPNGRDFAIKDVNKFEEIVLPRYFRHKKINSFIRQLNMYGFHKSRKDSAKSIFSHPNFLKGREDLLSSIKRKIKQPIVLSTPVKDKDASSNSRLQETAAKETEHERKGAEPGQFGTLHGFLESKEYLNSLFNLNASLCRVSMNQLADFKENMFEEQASIEQGLEYREKEEEKASKKFLNPSFFFGSERDQH